MRGATLIGQQQKINRLPVRKSVCFNEYHFAFADPNRILNGNPGIFIYILQSDA